VHGPLTLHTTLKGVHEMIAGKQKERINAYIPMLSAGMYQGLPQGNAGS